MDDNKKNPEAIFQERESSHTCYVFHGWVDILDLILLLEQFSVFKSSAR